MGHGTSKILVEVYGAWFRQQRLIEDILRIGRVKTSIEEPMMKLAVLNMVKVEMPDGEYPGVLGGGTVAVNYAGVVFYFRVEPLVKGINIPCVVVMSGDNASIEIKDSAGG